MIVVSEKSGNGSVFYNYLSVKNFHNERKRRNMLDDK